MYIVAIAWIYVVMLMALAETSFIAGLATFVFYGLLPLGVLLYLLGTPQRRRRALAMQAAQEAQAAQAQGGQAAQPAPTPAEAQAQTPPAQSCSQISEAIRPLPASRRNE